MNRGQKDDEFDPEFRLFAPRRGGRNISWAKNGTMG
jgi:hypothetical protein